MRATIFKSAIVCFEALLLVVPDVMLLDDFLRFIAISIQACVRGAADEPFILEEMRYALSGQ